jgi:hypothetical protein
MHLAGRILLACDRTGKFPGSQGTSFKRDPGKVNRRPGIFTKDTLSHYKNVTGRQGAFVKNGRVMPVNGKWGSVARTVLKNAIAKPGRTVARSLLPVLLTASFAGPALAAPLQCVPYAREHSGIEIHGNAWTWWNQAKGVYRRGSVPQVGAVVAMAPSSAMPLGHVAVVQKIVDERHILLDHANWSSPGKIEHGAMAEDVSTAGDWSEVRVWYAPSRALGSRVNPVFGFIYPQGSDTRTEIAAADSDDAAS